MGIIETLKTKKGRTAALGIGSIILATIFLTIQLLPAHKYSRDMAYFSDDDGKTWFKDSLSNIPPYDHDGKTAVRAIIYNYANGSKEFCGYLMQFPPSAKKAIDAAAQKATGAHIADIAYGENFAQLVQVKKPQSSDPWAMISTAAARPVLQVTSPDHSEIDSVLP